MGKPNSIPNPKAPLPRRNNPQQLYKKHIYSPTDQISSFRTLSSPKLPFLSKNSQLTYLPSLRNQPSWNNISQSTCLPHLLRPKSPTSPQTRVQPRLHYHHSPKQLPRSAQCSQHLSLRLQKTNEDTNCLEIPCTVHGINFLSTDGILTNSSANQPTSATSWHLPTTHVSNLSAPSYGHPRLLSR